MKELLQQIGIYAGEILIGSIALIVRSIEKKIVIRRARRQWLSGEKYSKIEKTETGQKNRCGRGRGRPKAPGG